MTSPGVPPYPDAEAVLWTLLESIAPTYTWLPQGWEPDVIQVQRIGGAPDLADVTDYPMMRVSYYGGNRNRSWQMAREGESLILGNRGRGIVVEDVGMVIMDSADIEVGGALEPDLDPDERRVTVNYVLGFRRQYHLVP